MRNPSARFLDRLVRVLATRPPGEANYGKGIYFSGFRIGASAACLELDRTTWRAGRVVTHVRQLFRGDRFDLVAEFNAGP